MTAILYTPAMLTALTLLWFFMGEAFKRSAARSAQQTELRHYDRRRGLADNARVEFVERRRVVRDRRTPHNRVLFK